MKKHIYLILTILSITTIATLQSQSIEEALQLSRTQPYTTARAMATGGVFNSLGADLSIIGTNPAGLANYKFGEFVLSLGYQGNTYKTNRDNSSDSNTENKFALQNIGLVLADRRNPNSRKIRFGMSYNVVSNYKYGFRYSNIDSPGTIVQRFIEVSDGIAPDDLDFFEGGPAFDAEAIYDPDTDFNYQTDFDEFAQFTDATTNKTQRVERSGFQSEVNLGIGGQIGNKLLLGGSLSIPIFKYEENNIYVEADGAQEVIFFDRLNYERQVDVSGAGVRFNAGVIYKVTDEFNIGLSGSTPSVFILDDDYATSLTYDFTDDDGSFSNTATSPVFDGPFTYQLSAAPKASISMSKINKKGKWKGFVATDITAVFYKGINFDLTYESNNPLDAAFSDELDQQIDDTYQTSIEASLGIEQAKEGLRYRLGGTLVTSPIAENSSLGYRIGGGLGYRINRIFIDGAVQYRKDNNFRYSPYKLVEPSDEVAFNVSGRRWLFNMTLGVKL